ncbi:MAG: hypothetical protein ACXVE8_04755 [Solirubrobacteraceae bacterium]
MGLHQEVTCMAKGLPDAMRVVFDDERAALACPDHAGHSRRDGLN